MNNPFKNKKKLINFIVTIVIIVLAVIIVFNDKAASLFNDFTNAPSGANGTDSKPVEKANKSTKKNQNDNILDSKFGSVESDYSTTNREGTNYSATNKSSLPTLTNEYSTTNRDNFWTEYRGDYKDGDEAADAEMKQRRRDFGR